MKGTCQTSRMIRIITLGQTLVFNTKKNQLFCTLDPKKKKKNALVGVIKLLMKPRNYLANDIQFITISMDLWFCFSANFSFISEVTLTFHELEPGMVCQMILDKCYISNLQSILVQFQEPLKILQYCFHIYIQKVLLSIQGVFWL